MKTYICKLKPYIQPFEKVLAFRELESITNANIIKPLDSNVNNDLFELRSNVPIKTLLDRLTYWEQILDDTNNTFYPQQIFREASSFNGNKQKIIEKSYNQNNFKIPNRRVLRYATHGIHEYRGKFFPQLVKSLINIAGINNDSVILDPMCGSGTTLLESIIFGCNTIGIDLNPLSVLISKVKCNTPNLSIAKIIREKQHLEKRILKDKQIKRTLSWTTKLSESSKKYLMNWFREDILFELDIMMTQIDQIENSKIKEFFTLSLSNILRRVSFQKNDDLRVRKEHDKIIKKSAIDEYSFELEKAITNIMSFQQYENKTKFGKTLIFQGDARESVSILKDYVGRVDAIITSPPYATALPYLDTDRLSLYFLNLIPRKHHKQYDINMIGNREITKSLRDHYLELFIKEKHILTEEIASLIEEIDHLNNSSNVGFRRKNLSALLSKYFFSMNDVLKTFKVLLRKNAYAFVIVGNNHTIAGNKRIAINTNNLLANLGKSIGLELIENIPMDMLISRDIFKKNSSTKESIIVFKNT